MKPHHQTYLGRRRRDNRLGMRWVLSIVLSLSVFLAQSIPAMADHGLNTSSWLEICGDGGSYFIQIGEDGQEQEDECAHCDYCLTPVWDTSAVHSTNHGVSVLISFANISFTTDQAIVPVSPEQYWSACRGPPIVSVEKS